VNQKFDVVIGNPPYQEESDGGATHGKPIYHLFMTAAFGVGKKVVLITPARFLFDAGYTPKAWNKKMLDDPHLSVAHYEDNSDDLFPGTDIKGGIAVTYRDTETTKGPIGTFTRYPEIDAIVEKVGSQADEFLDKHITSSRSYGYTSKMHEENPDLAKVMSAGETSKVNTRTLEQLSVIYHSEEPADGFEYVQMLGLVEGVRVFRWIRRDYVTGPESFEKYKVAVPAANGSGRFGDVMSTPLVLGPKVAVTQTFITIGSFGKRSEADACLKYVKSKFTRALLGALKVTQHNPARVWRHIPLQEFSRGSDIDWGKPVPEVDQQLYDKYGLTSAEASFIEANVESME
jgi:hypothetical protein